MSVSDLSAETAARAVDLDSLSAIERKSSGWNPENVSRNVSRCYVQEYGAVNRSHEAPMMHTAGT